MPKIALTDRFVAAAKPLEADQTDYFDTVATGLALRVSANFRSWTFVFTSPRDGKRARLTLGRYPSMPLAKARGLAIEMKGNVQDGMDPRDVKAAQDASAMTFNDLFKVYMEQYANLRLRSASSIERRLKADALPMLGSIKIADMHKRDVNRVLDTILKRGAPIQARLVFQNLRAIFRWAVSRGDLEHNPIEGLKAPAADQARERVLNDTEIRALWNGLSVSLAKSKACQRIVKLCLVTGQRIGEVSGLRKDELNFVQALWQLPGSRTKNGQPHAVPLSAMAAEIIKEAIADAGNSAFVFPVSEEGHLLPSAVSRTIGRANETDDDRPMGRFGIAQFTAHDLRRTALTEMAKLGVSPIVLGHVANHVSVTRGGVTLNVYNKYGYDREKRQALDLWAERLQAIVDGKGADVIPLKGKMHAS